jgi:3-hydroxyacyl-CoA dehydrogenase / enoyl-CoA hydratase / 3-hydroxybutyryl-CoA epimerase
MPSFLNAQTTNKLFHSQIKIMSILNIEKDGNVAIVILNDPDEKVNKLNEKLIDEFTGFLDDLRSDNELRGAILMSGKDDNFIAGADIDMFKTRETAEEMEELSRTGHEVLLEIENFPKPIVACIHGSCMGGGTELALACHYRIVSDSKDTKIALPEVKLGLIPGMGGTQRLPRLIGIQKSLPYLLTGRNMYSRQTRRTGFADEVVSRHKMKQAGIEAVQKYANRKIERKDRRGFFERLIENNGLGRLIIFSQAHKKTAAQTRGNYPAPPQIIESVRYGFKEGLRSGLKNESRIFGKMAVTPESRALVQLFFAMNDAKKNPDKEIAKQVKQIGVLGAGLMGSGITEVSINQGYHVWLKDQEVEQAIKGKKTIQDNLQKEVDKRIITQFEKDSKLSYIHPADTYDSFGNIGLVIEAVFEDLELKRNIVDEVEANTGEQCIFASNTSSLPISDIAERAKRPENIIGMHYFSPVQKMPLLEIIKTGQTADWVTSTAYEVGIRQGKTVIVVNDGPGFYTTRILAPFMNEALLLLEEGAAIEQVDKALKDFGFPVGPVALFDEVGIDVGAHVADVLSNKFEARGAKTSKKAAELVNAGFKGRKNKKGFYTYNGRKKDVNTDIYRFFGGTERQKFDEDEIQFRLAMMMVNEAVYCLQEGILQNPKAGDLGAILGLGFPPFLGGPFRYIDREGADEVVNLMQELAEDYGKRFEPAELLTEYASQNKTFHSD